MKMPANQLYYITHMNNLSSILKHGILSHAEIQKRNIRYEPIYDEQVVSKRGDRVTPDGNSLLEYANLYVQARNPMLYRVVCEMSSRNVVVLAVKQSVVDLPGVFVTDGNAVSSMSTIMPAKHYSKVVRLLKRYFDLEYWKEEDGSKRRIMAECLIPKKVDPEYIEAIYVADDKVAEKVKKNLPGNLAVIPEPQLFFRNPMVVQLTPNLSLFKGDMFFSRMHTLTVSVNIVGVMGKGLASRAKYQFPDVYIAYQDACRRKKLSMGRPFLYKRETSLDHQLAYEPFTMKNGNGQTWFLLFPTKRHWREDSDLDAIEQGMIWLRENYKKEGIKSLAIPALGCGLGNLEWKDVGPMLCRYLSDLDIPVQLYLPTEKEIAEEYLDKNFLLSKK